MRTPLLNVVFRFGKYCFVVGVVSALIGLFLNSLVMNANNGSMPVAVHHSDIMMVIGDRQHLLPERFFIPEPDDPRHHILTEKSRLAFLSDRIYLGPTVVTMMTLRTCTALRKTLSDYALPRLETLCPFAAYRLASIGDFFIWWGVVCFLVTILVLSLLWTIDLFAAIKKLATSLFRHIQ